MGGGFLEQLFGGPQQGAPSYAPAPMQRQYEPAPGYVEFLINGRPYKLDAVGDDDGLFFIFKDGTAGDTTYGPGRFLYVEKKPQPGETFMLDLNRIYNPPCAFSEYTTCPLPPKQNILKAKIEAGEKYPPKRAG